MAKKILGDIVVRFGGETGEWKVALDRANSQLAAAGKSFEGKLDRLPRVSQAVSASVSRSFKQIGEAARTNSEMVSRAVEKTEGNITRLTATRAFTRGLSGTPSITSAERFLGDYLKLGDYAKTIFPITGGLAVGVLLQEFAGKIEEVRASVERLENAPKVITEGFRKINLAAETTNDTLAVQNAKLDAEIAKLQGKPRNGLETAIVNVRVETEKLTESLDAANSAVAELLQKNTNENPLSTFFDSHLSDIDKLKQQQGEYQTQMDAIMDNAREINRGMSSSGKIRPGHPLGIHFIGNPTDSYVSATKQALALNKKSIDDLLRERKAALHNPSGLHLLGLPQDLAALNGILNSRMQERRQLEERLANLQKQETVSKLKAHPVTALVPAKHFEFTHAMQARLDAFATRTKKAQAGFDAKMAADQSRLQESLARTAEARDKAVEKINAHTAALKNLQSVVGLGIGAQRGAQLENLRNQGRANGLDPSIIAAQAKEQQAQWNLQDAQARDRQQQMEKLQAIVHSTAHQVKDILGGAFESLGSIMTRMIAGQKGAWASFFAQLGGEFAQLGINKVLGLALKGVGFQLPAFAAGGYSPGGPILVGENGPEIISSRRGDYITPNGKLGNGGATYYIDARGANAADVEMRVHRALVAVHGSAVRTAVAAQKEIRARSPRSKFQP